VFQRSPCQAVRGKKGELRDVPTTKTEQMVNIIDSYRDCTLKKTKIGGRNQKPKSPDLGGRQNSSDQMKRGESPEKRLESIPS